MTEFVSEVPDLPAEGGVPSIPFGVDLAAILIDAGADEEITITMDAAAAWWLWGWLEQKVLDHYRRYGETEADREKVRLASGVKATLAVREAMHASEFHRLLRKESRKVSATMKVINDEEVEQ